MKKLLFVVVLAIAISCSKDDEPVINPDTTNETDPVNDSITYFTLKVNDLYIGDFINSSYLIINDNEGNILANTQIENSKEYVFKAKKGEEKESFTVSSFRYRNGEFSQFNLLGSYFNIKKGAVWNFNGYDPSTVIDNNGGTNGELKNFSLKIQNIEGYSKAEISSNRGPIGSSYSGTTNSIEYDPISFYENYNKFLITVHFKSEKSKYILIDNIQDQQEVIVDGSELKEFDSYIPIHLPNDGNIYNKGLMARLPSNEVYSTSSFTEIKSLETSNFGMLEDFYIHTIDVFTSNHEKNYNYRYSRTSPEKPKPVTIEYSTDFKLINNSRNAFEFTTGQKYTTKASAWSYYNTNAINNFYLYSGWIFNSNELPYQTLPKLPQEFLDLYPQFTIEDLEYEYTSFSNGSIYENFFTGVNSFDNTKTWFRESLTFENPDYNRSFKKNKDFEKMRKEFQHYNPYFSEYTIEEHSKKSLKSFFK